MPAKVTSWVEGTGELALLNISSSDPRSNGTIELAYFESDIAELIASHQWAIRSKRIENEEGIGLQTFICNIRKLGMCRIEPNECYCKYNLRGRTPPKFNVQAMQAGLKEYKEANPYVALEDQRFAFERYKSKSEWTTVTVECQAKGCLSFKINKVFLRYIPKRLYFCGKTKQFHLWPTAEQKNRRDQTLRHGERFITYLCNCLGLPHNCRGLQDIADYRYDFDTNCFIGSTHVRNVWTELEDGWLLEVIAPRNSFTYIWPPGSNLEKCTIPNDRTLVPEEQKSSFAFIDKTEINEFQEYVWQSNPDKFFSNTAVEFPKLPLKNLVCSINNANFKDVFIPAEMTARYKKAVEGGLGDVKMARVRSKLENMAICEMSTNNRMYKQARRLQYKKVYCEKFIELVVNGKTITAMDMRFQSIRIGGRKNI